jgi:hypothetical protein
MGGAHITFTKREATEIWITLEIILQRIASDDLDLAFQLDGNTRTLLTKIFE